MSDVDALNARRERRRRRILENADDRIKRFTGVKKPVSADVPTSLPFGDDSALGREPFEDADAKKTCGFAATEQCDEPVALDEVGPVGNYNDEDATTGMEESGLKQRCGSRINYRALMLLALGLTIRYLNLLFENCARIVGVDLTFLHIDSIFMPFLIFEVTEFFVSRPSMEANMTLILILSLNNMKGYWVDVTMNVVNSVLQVLRDMSIYFFAYVFLDVAFTALNSDKNL